MASRRQGTHRTAPPSADPLRRRGDGSTKLLRQFFLGFVRIHILHHASVEPVCGADLSEELGRHGYRLSPGMLYPVLHDLAAAGYLRCSPQITAGRLRKPYVLTPRGRAVLRQARQQIRELVEEVANVRDRQPPS